MQRTGLRTGLLGGSFNPAHGGHRRISLFALEALGLDEIWWLVSPGNPLKSASGMASQQARYRSAVAMARRAPICVTAIENALGTRYTVDTLRSIQRRYSKRHFTWLMASDNLATFHKWRAWRDIARSVPIAVIARPGYDTAAIASPAMAWLGRHFVEPGDLFSRGRGSLPRLVSLRFDPDPRSATAIRRANPDWADDLPTGRLFDQVTHRPLFSGGDSPA